MRRPLFLLLWLSTTYGGEFTRDLEVSEGAPVGTRIGYIGDDFSGENGPPYLIIPVQQGLSVENDLDIDQKSGEIRVKTPLDRETRPSYYFVAVPINGQNIRVTVRVTDENDHAPTFPSSLLYVEFPENSGKDSKRTLSPATDLDLGSYNTQRYEIVSGNINNAFKLHYHREKDDVLYLDLQANGMLDRESIPSYSLVIEAWDGGSPPLKGTTTVNALIRDVNDNQPIFNRGRYWATIPENSTLGSPVLSVHATDADSGDNGAVEYFINRRQSDKENFFEINARTGLLTVAKMLDFESKQTHELVVVARDKGEQPLETTAFVTVTVTDVNDNQPTIDVIFLNDEAAPKISEDAVPGEFVARISVNDPDSKTNYPNANVTLIGGDDKFGLTTRENVVYIVVVSSLDREAKSSYEIVLTTSDNGIPPLHATNTFVMTVTDANDNVPVFDSSVFYGNVLEITEVGAAVVRISATDADEGANAKIKYGLATNPYDWFQIDSDTGIVSTKLRVDCETEANPTFSVTATDGGEPALTATATVSVTVHDVNDNEPIFGKTYYNATISEDISRGSCVLQVWATDSDCGVNSMVNYTLSVYGGDVNPFYVKSTTGHICLEDAYALDYEKKRFYEFAVVATDRGGLSATSIVGITVTDANDNSPRFQPQQYRVSVADAAALPPNAALLTVRATDADSDEAGRVSYVVVAGNDDGIFAVDGGTGVVRVAKPRSLRKDATYAVNVSAVDGAGRSSTSDAVVLVDVASGPSSPRFATTKYAFVASQAATVGSVIGTAALRDSLKYGGQSVKYWAFGDQEGGYFAVDEANGDIRVAAPLAAGLTYLAVAATSQSWTVYAQVEISVESSSKEKSWVRFEYDTVRLSVPEDAPIGSVLYVARVASVANVSSRPKYALQRGGGKLFEVDERSGAITVNGRLDYETTRRHTLTVGATISPSTTSGNLTLLIEVQDVNDNAPVFERAEYAVEISEAAPVDSQIAQVTAVDLDTGNNAKITYSLSEPSPTLGIRSSSGWLYSKRAFDREKTDSYAVRVIARDKGPSGRLSATATVRIRIADYNDNAPVFAAPRYQFRVEENSPRGTVLGTVVATDADLGANAVVRYSLLTTNSTFDVDPFTGELSCEESPDREEKETHELIIEARDEGTPARSSRVKVVVKVGDANDNSPLMVDPREDVVSVREQQSPGTEVVKVRASDPDSGRNGTVTYSILKGEGSDGYGMFSMDAMTGVLRTRVALSHEEKSAYRLIVAATDNGDPPRQSTRLLRIEVLHLNDNAPTFTSSTLTFKVREDVSIGHVIGNVLGLDSSNRLSAGQIKYSLSSSEASVQNTFAVDGRSGALVLIGQLDRETRSSYQFQANALDSATNPQSTSVSINVVVEDVNDNHPVWDSSDDIIEIKVKEDAIFGTIIYNLTATDADMGANADVRYALTDQWPMEAFALDSVTGHLSVSADLDYEYVKIYTLVAKARDQAWNISEQLETSVAIRIKIEDVNDNWPNFTYPISKDIKISNSARKGARVCRVFAADLDSRDNGRVSYTISAGNENGLFDINDESGVITLAKNLAGKVGTYRANVTASDRGFPTQRHSTITLNIMATASETRSSVRFSESVYRVNVSEDTSVGHTIYTVSARISDYSGGGSDSLIYEIAEGAADGTFIIDRKQGFVILEKPLDRESVSSYVIPIYARDAKSERSDRTLVLVTVIDVNDNSPAFEEGACYPLFIPENSPPMVAHTVAAVDNDFASNGKILYSISGGNVGNKFQMDSESGELVAQSLDRESVSKYYLSISAQDEGSNPHSLTSVCNITVTVLDENDNSPQFRQRQYIASVAENVTVGAVVLTVEATDADVGENGRITYSLVNEADATFAVDNETGVVRVASNLDREKQNVYAFQIKATDNGKYSVNWEVASVQISVDDVNDNAPQFMRYPFSANDVSPNLHAGAEILRVVASDKDRGANGDVTYQLASDTHASKFRVNANSGVVTSAVSLAEYAGEAFYLPILATDKGTPPLSAMGLVEIKISDGKESEKPSLRFQNSTYNAYLRENCAVGDVVAQVLALRSDGRRQKITYSIGNGNENDAFDMDANSGTITIKRADAVDFERNFRTHLVALARADNAGYAFANVWIHAIDQNDNAPVFTQPAYFATVKEAQPKSSIVCELLATDADEGANSRVTYHIVDGNHDNAFAFEPPSSSTIRTNIVLDREIRDSYVLTIVATDQGVPQMTATTTVDVRVLDVNDNRPFFPPSGAISLSEKHPVGTLVASVAANDVDSYPPLIYTLDGNAAGESFAVDSFSGGITLKKSLDYERVKEYRFNVNVSDGSHRAVATVTVSVLDENDNTPAFDKNFYQFALPDGNTKGEESAVVSASDADSSENGLVSYSISEPVAGFAVDADSGLIAVNRSLVDKQLLAGGYVDLSLRASDSGIPKLSSTVVVRFEGQRDALTDGTRSFPQSEYEIRVREDQKRGTRIFKLTTLDEATRLNIVAGDEDNQFDIAAPSGDLILTKELDREKKDAYSLRLGSFGNVSSRYNIRILVDDSNDNEPQFLNFDRTIDVAENTAPRSALMRISATDKDAGSNADVRYKIIAGDDWNLFSIDADTGVISSKERLDYDRGENEYKLIAMATDNPKNNVSQLPLSSLTTLRVRILDENDNAPKFPISEYLEFVSENEPAGTVVFTAKATDEDKGRFGKLNYSLVSAAAPGYAQSDESWKMFNVDERSGVVTTNAVFDYEARSRYAFAILTCDAGGKCAKANVKVEIEGKDEYYPQFAERAFRFVVNGDYQVGHVVGYVTATDRDKGGDGRISYQLTSRSEYFKMNRTSGALIVKKKIDYDALSGEANLIVTASSGSQGSLANTSMVEIVSDSSSAPAVNLASNSKENAVSTEESGVSAWSISLFAVLIVAAICAVTVPAVAHLKNVRRRERHVKPSLGSSRVDYVDASAFGTLPLRVASSPPSNPFGPPKYDEIPTYRVGGGRSGSNSVAQTTSELSESVRSGSSGRGSAEYPEDVDEEIRMINEGKRGARKCGQDDDMSDVSVRNTRDYLARLGIVEAYQTSGAPSHRGSSLKGGTSACDEDTANVIYAKLGSERGGANDDTERNGTSEGSYSRIAPNANQPSMSGSLSSIVHCEEELTGSYNWDYLLDWGPQYQPLAHVFSEIARLKDDAASVKSCASGASGGPPRTFPPPLLTTVAPRSAVAPPKNAHLSTRRLLESTRRSPINHESFCTSSAMSPSFSPALSPLAARSPSISPLHLHSTGKPPHFRTNPSAGR